MGVEIKMTDKKWIDSGIYIKHKVNGEWKSVLLEDADIYLRRNWVDNLSKKETTRCIELLCNALSENY